MELSQNPTTPKGNEQPQRGPQRTFRGSSLTFPSFPENNLTTPTSAAPDTQKRESNPPTPGSTGMAPEMYQQPTSGMHHTMYQHITYQHKTYSTSSTHLPGEGMSTFMGYEKQPSTTMHQTPVQLQGQEGGYMDAHGFRRSFPTPPMPDNANMHHNLSKKRRGSSPSPLASKRQNASRPGQAQANEDNHANEYKSYEDSSNAVDFGTSSNSLFDLPDNFDPACQMYTQHSESPEAQNVIIFSQGHQQPESLQPQSQPQQQTQLPPSTEGKYGFGPPKRCSHIFRAKTGTHGNSIPSTQCGRTFHPKYAGQTHCYNHKNSQAHPATFQKSLKPSQPILSSNGRFGFGGLVLCGHVFPAKKGKKGLIEATRCQRTFFPARMEQGHCYQHELYHKGEETQASTGGQQQPQRKRTKDSLVQCAHVFPSKGAYVSVQCQKRFGPRYTGNTHCYDHRSEETKTPPVSKTVSNTVPLQTPQQQARLSQAFLNTNQPFLVKMGSVADHDYQSPGIRCAFTWAGHWNRPEQQCRVMFHPTEKGQSICPIHILCKAADPLRL